jgi:flagellar biosynthesis anti-sigma factor FlgM
MEIHGPAHLHGAQAIRGPHRVQGAEAPQTSPALYEADRVEISAAADLVSRVHDLPDVRSDKVAGIRQQIEAGTYETEAKLEIAVGRLLDELAG